MEHRYQIIGLVNTTHYGIVPILDIPVRDDDKDKKAPCLTADQSNRQET